MYVEFYGLKGFPFQLTPDYRFFFGSRTHRKAMAYLTYGMSKGEGFVIFTGEVGAGKTTLIDQLLSSPHAENAVVAKISTTQLESDDLLRMVASAFGISIGGAGKADLLLQLEAFLLHTHRAGRRAIIIVDEAQSLRPSALEELRMLSNFGEGPEPVLQLFLVGQPEFRRLLMGGDFEQLRQRVIASYHLRPLDAADTRCYIEHRLAHVGWQSDPRFTDEAHEEIFDHTGGVPRKINRVCDRLLLFGFLEEKHEFLLADVKEVLNDLDEELALGQDTAAGERADHASEPTGAFDRPHADREPRRPAGEEAAGSRNIEPAGHPPPFKSEERTIGGAHAEESPAAPAKFNQLNDVIRHFEAVAKRATKDGN
jgi:putative secretion ATPase (PEP-CTERM system associated)